MTKETNKQIIADAPEGATHFDGGVWVQSTGKQPLEKWNDMDWDYEDAYEMDNIRSLDDIRENIALQERVAGLEKLNKTIESLMRSGERRGREKAKEKYSKALAQKDKRIAELRHENLILKAHYCLDRISGNIDTIMLDKMQAKRDLEQQAKALKDYKQIMSADDVGRDVYRGVLNNEITQLENQAKQLKGEE